MANRVHYHVSLIDTDLYKLTMQNAICKLYPTAKARYTFVNRDNREFPDDFGKRLKEIIDFYRSDDMVLQRDEYDFLREKCYYLNPVYLDFLRGFRYDPSEVIIRQIGSKLEVEVIGYWYRTVLWEVPLMSTISELYFEITGQRGVSIEKRTAINREKAVGLAQNGINYSEFGTRRRHSFENQKQAVNDFKSFGEGHMLGTSNPYLAMINDLTPMGTVAHEWYSFHGARYGYKMANLMASDAWVKVYEGNLGIALPDTFTTDVFLRTFNTFHAKLWDGLRQDSANPFAFINKIEAHYQKLRINPMVKMAMFSDNLNTLKKIVDIHNACLNRIPDRYGLGTWLSNDVGVDPLKIVIKLTGCNWDGDWVHAIKLSDDVSKNTGDSNEVKLCKRVLDLD